MPIKPIYNEAKLEEFKASDYCPEKLRKSTLDEIYDNLDREDVELMYNSFVHMRWIREQTRRAAAAKTSSRKLSLQDRLRRQEAFEAMRDAQLEEIRLQPIQQPGVKNYAKLFGDTIDARDWTDVELEVRKLFFDELEKSRKSGGCSGCRRRALVSKYVARLRELEM